MQSNKISPSVAIVILNWNGKHFLEQFLPSVLDSQYENFAIYVADNASSDGSVELLKNTFSSVKIIELNKNFGFAEGYNRALKNLKEEYFVLLNSDVKVTPKWIAPVIELMESDKQIAACQPKILSLNNPEYFEYAGACGGWIDKNVYPFCRGRIFDFCEKDEGQYDDAVPIFWASGAALFIRSNAYQECRGMDEYFFAHQEEIDLCWRLQNAGYKIFVQPSSVVYHLGGGSLQQGSTRKVFLNFRNNLIMMYKNLDKKERTPKILKRMALDGVAGGMYLVKGKLSYVIAILKAHGAFYRWLWNHKTDNHSRKRLCDLAGVFDGSIVKTFFIQRQKVFSQIVGNKK
ncbi:MAG: glycosyltransferase family 2 protein [Chitinophagaceae bacterium]|nr:glycosyltransferase family 2 protein [Chitinophagaceae bacterium]